MCEIVPRAICVMLKWFNGGTLKQQSIEMSFVVHLTPGSLSVCDVLVRFTVDLWGGEKGNEPLGKLMHEATSSSISARLLRSIHTACYSIHFKSLDFQYVSYQQPVDGCSPNIL